MELLENLKINHNMHDIYFFFQATTGVPVIPTSQCNQDQPGSTNPTYIPIPTLSETEIRAIIAITFPNPYPLDFRYELLWCVRTLTLRMIITL